MNNSNNSSPSLYIKKVGEQTTKLELKLTSVNSKVVVRFTGGCGYMSEDDATGLYESLTNAFLGYQGSILFGGTRMLKKDNTSIIVPGITEIPPLIRAKCPDCVILGVVPKSEDLAISEHGVIVSDNEKNDYFTIVHPNQDQCLIVQQSVDEGVSWEAEYEECIRITADLRKFAGFKSLLISYNGGSITEKEILATAKLGWPVVLIKGSGRKTDEYANNAEFLDKYPNVVIAEKKTLREVLELIGIVEKTKERKNVYEGIRTRQTLSGHNPRWKGSLVDHEYN